MFSRRHKFGRYIQIKDTLGPDVQQRSKTDLKELDSRIRELKLEGSPQSRQFDR